jgi:hypothetical protein
VKCPRCAAVIAVPGATDPDDAEPTPAPPPAPKRKPTPVRGERRDDAGEPADLPLLSFEELKIPPRIRKRIEDEAGGEEVLWIGRQDPAARLKKARVGVYAGIGMAVFGTIVLVLTFIMAGKSAAKDVPKDVPKEQPKEAPKEAPKDVEQDAPKDVEKEAGKAAKKGKSKGKAVDPEEAKAKAAAKEAAREEAKAKAAAKEAAREDVKVKEAERDEAKAKEQRNLTLLIGGGFAAVIWLMALPLLFLPLITRRFMHNRDCYVITDSRALIVGYIRRLTFTRGELSGRNVEIRPNGIGNIQMGYVESTEYRGKHKETRREPVGFMDVADVEEVEQYLRQKLRLSAPKSYDHVKG